MKPLSVILLLLSIALSILITLHNSQKSIEHSNLILKQNASFQNPNYTFDVNLE